MLHSFCYRASKAKAISGAATSNKAGKAAASAAGWRGAVSPKANRVGKAPGRTVRRSFGSGSGGSRAGTIQAAAAAALASHSPQMSGGLPPMGHSFSLQDVCVDSERQRRAEQQDMTNRRR